MFSIGDRVVYPMHGAGVIESIKDMDILGKKEPYYIVKLPAACMKVMIPVSSSNEGSLRPIVSLSGAKQLLNDIDKLDIKQDNNWSRRYRENMDRLKSGDLVETAKVFKSLVMRNKEKGLSAGERKMLQSAKQILISELMFSLDKTKNEIEDYLNSALG